MPALEGGAEVHDPLRGMESCAHEVGEGRVPALGQDDQGDGRHDVDAVQDVWRGRIHACAQEHGLSYMFSRAS